MSNVRDFGARGDGQADDTQALQHAIQRGDGEVFLPRGDYLLSRPVQIPLQMHGRVHIHGQGGTARLLMTGAGPALQLIGTHRSNALPANINEQVWTKERMPIIEGLEIVGQHAQADGVRVEGVMQPTLQNLLIRRCRHGIHLTNRNRNVLIANCHIYNNTGIGIFFDRVNLHQTIIDGSHISYCKQGGIRISDSEIRNIQICGNDIEYNHDLEAEASADVFFDCRNGTVREGTLVGNTIQAVLSPGGANVRFVGVGRDNPNAVGIIAITGNMIGSQQTTLDLRACRGVVVSGNSFYNGFHNALWAEDCDQLVIGPNSIDHNSDYPGNSTDRLVLRRCRNVNITGLLLQHTRAAAIETTTSLEVRDCENINIVGCQLINARLRGIQLHGSRVVRVADCTIRGRAEDETYRAGVSVEEGCTQLMITNNFLGRGSDGELRLPAETGTASGNVMI